MRVLFAVWPAPSHLYPALPLAWALQGAGHEVCIASHPELAGAITAAGMTAVPLGTEATMPSLSMESVTGAGLDQATLDRLAEVLAIPPDQQHLWIMFSHYLLTSMHMFHAVGAPDQRCPGVDDLVDFARHWRPELVLWDVCWPSAAVAARVCGAAQARLLWGPDYCGWGRQLAAGRRAELAAAGLPDPLTWLVEPVAERYGVDLDEELLLGQWTVDPTPAEVRLPVPTRVVPVRRIPYAGAAPVPDWLYPRPRRPRVALTLGTSARAFGGQESMVGDLLAMLADLDVEVVATLDEVQLAGLEVPPNVRPVTFIPLTQLLPTCSAVIHHGGGGTFTAAVAHRVPQLVELADGAEAQVYADYLTGRGGGLTLAAEDSVDDMRKQLVRLLSEPMFQDGVAALHADWLAMPSPHGAVPVLEKLTGQYRGR